MLSSFFFASRQQFTVIKLRTLVQNVSTSKIEILSQNININGKTKQSLLSRTFSTTKNSAINYDEKNGKIRLSKLISQCSTNMVMSRREAERYIKTGNVTVAGVTITAPGMLYSYEEALGTIKLQNKLVLLDKPSALQELEQSRKLHNGDNISIEINRSNTKVWLVNKLKGEMVSEDDPNINDKRFTSMIERLVYSGVGKDLRTGIQKYHLKPVGRLDVSTEGLILITNNGHYARQLELPSNKLWRTYRVRVHGHLLPYKLKAIRTGNVRMPNSNIRYKPMKVQIEASNNTKRGLNRANTWLLITCTEGKNRQIRNILKQLGLTVTRLIRTSFGDYELKDMAPGMAIEVPVKPLETQKLRGELKFSGQSSSRKAKSRRQIEFDGDDENPQPVQWIHVN